MKNFALILGVVFVLFSCDSDKSKSSKSTDVQSSKQTSKKSKLKSYDCLKQYEDNYDKLITKAELASVYPFDLDEAKVKVSNSAYGEHMIRWPSDRPDLKLKVAGMNMEAPDFNSIGVANLSFSSDKIKLESIRQTFDMGYKELSDEELKAIQKNLEKSDTEVRDTGKNLMEVRKKRKSEFVDGVGSSAWYKWNEDYGGELAVLAGRAKFTVKIKVSDDAQENKELAKKLAMLILEKCK